MDEETDSETVERLTNPPRFGEGDQPQAGGGDAAPAAHSPPDHHPASQSPPPPFGRSPSPFRGGSVLPEAYRLNTPASPHLAAELDGVAIDIGTLMPPETNGPLVIEGAGGALVPVTRDTVFADIFARWALPVIVCARTGLGTINHSLLTIEALRGRGVPIHGIAFIGDPMPDSEAIIPALSGIRRLGRLPRIDPLTPETLAAAFAANFDRQDFR
ncbi:dethiobiotin synthase [Sphingomonas colocasiae]|uniref:Dethiobiotin synthase n=1 Tax=Sphingomonas colocasiae TaxID=1848973 RepID=A0ABS7PII4_9SPHN|nr:dethiobiotin synthase [Sphingomonas colocasiae]